MSGEKDGVRPAGGGTGPDDTGCMPSVVAPSSTPAKLRARFTIWRKLEGAEHDAVLGKLLHRARELRNDPPSGLPMATRVLDFGAGGCGLEWDVAGYDEDELRVAQSRMQFVAFDLPDKTRFVDSWPDDPGVPDELFGRPYGPSDFDRWICLKVPHRYRSADGSETYEIQEGARRRVAELQAGNGPPGVPTPSDVVEGDDATFLTWRTRGPLGGSDVKRCTGELQRRLIVEGEFMVVSAAPPATPEDAPSYDLVEFLEVDLNDALEFAQRVIDVFGSVTVTLVHADGDTFRGSPAPTWTFHVADSNLASFLKLNARGWNVYWNPNTTRCTGKKASKEVIKTVNVLHVDVDPAKDRDLEKERERIRDSLSSHEPAPSILVDSGNGYQACWLLSEPVSLERRRSGDKMRLGGGAEEPLDELEADRWWQGRVEEMESRSRGLEAALGADSCHDVDRVLRMPGTTNWPDAKKRAVRRVPALARVIHFHEDYRYELRQFEPAGPRKKSSRAREKAPVVVDMENIRRIESLDELPQSVGPKTKVLIAQGTDPADPTKYPSRSEVLWRVVCDLVRDGVEDEVIYSIITDNRYAVSESVLDKVSDSAVERYALRQIERARVAAEEFTCEDGKPVPSQRNVRIGIAKLGLELELDEFSGRSLVHGLEEFGTALNDAAVNHMWLRIEEQFRLFVKRERFWAIVQDQALRNKRHPVREYLAGLEWDGTPRLDSWLTTYLGVENSEYARAVGRIVLVAAVRRVRKPGCKFDEMMVLEGKQGTSKSTALGVLAVCPDWFSDDLPLNADAKRFIESTAGRWIVEAGELKGMRKGDVEHLKSCLSRRIDRARMSYGRLPIEVPRQFVVIGTTNSERYLRDNTGNRRFWPVRTGTIDLERLQRDRDQLWAEAVAREAADDSIRLESSLYSDAAQAQEERRVVDPFLDSLSATLGDREGKIAARTVWEILGIQPDRRTQDMNQRMGDAMRELGWERKQARFGGKPEGAYVKGEGRTALEAETDHRGRFTRLLPELGNEPF